MPGEQLSRRTGPVQSAGTTQAITQAVFAELAERGMGNLTIESVARRAGVGKAAVYRRWTSKQTMVLTLVTDVATRAELFPATGSLESDLRVLLTDVEQHLRHPLISRIVPDLLAVAARDRVFAEALHQRIGVVRRGLATSMLDRAVERGELPEHLDRPLAADLIVAPLYWRLAVTREPFSPADLDQLVTMTIAALQAPSVGAGPPA